MGQPPGSEDGRLERENMKDYMKEMKWALVNIVDRSTQDNRRSKVKVEALFQNPVQAEDNYIIRNPEHKRYILFVDYLERFERYYNDVQDLNEEYGDHAIFHLEEISQGYEWDTKFRTILDIWTSTEL